MAKSCVHQKDDHGQIAKHKCCMIHLHDLDHALVLLALMQFLHYLRGKPGALFNSFPAVIKDPRKPCTGFFEWHRNTRMLSCSQRTKHLVFMCAAQRFPILGGYYMHRCVHSTDRPYVLCLKSPCILYI
jgi:hypothetical protein